MTVSNHIILVAVLMMAVWPAGADVQERISQRSERAVLGESTAVEQARARAQSRSEYGLELRPGVTDEDVGLALRIYLPSRWSRSRLREQLALVAETEQLRVAALEWQELTEVYRLFCDYRMHQGRMKLYEREMELLEPYLEQADLSVQLNRLSVEDRARLYSLYLDLLNGRNRSCADRIEVEQDLRMLLGADADLERMAGRVKVDMPPRNSFVTMLDQALHNRSDYRIFDVRARSLEAAAAVAREEDGFRLKYIQPGYEVDYNNGESSIGLTASFILPWGTRNPDIAAYQQELLLARSSMQLQRSVIEHRLCVLIKTANDYFKHADQCVAAIKPLLEKLNADLELLNTGRLEDLRNVMLIRERILDVSVNSLRYIRRKEQIAVDLAAEIGVLTP